MAEAAGPSEPWPSSGGPIQPGHDPTSSDYADDDIRCSSCGIWKRFDQFQSRAKGRRPYTRTCLSCREDKVRISRPEDLRKLLTSRAFESGRTTISETCEDCWTVSW